MLNMRTRMAMALCLALPICLGMCAASVLAQNTPPKKAQVAVPIPPLQVKVKTDHAVYAADKDIVFTMTVKNTTQAPLMLMFRSGQRFDVELRKDKTVKVWQWAKGRMFTMALGTTTLQPGKSVTYTETYRPGKPEMPALAPGSYTVVATVPANSNPDLTATSTFQVK